MKLGSENIKKILVEDTQQFKLSEDLGATNLTHSPSKSKDGSEVFTDPTNSTTPNAGEQQISDIFEKKEVCEVTFVGQALLKRPISVVSCIQSGDLRVVPIMAIDFSMGNLTFSDDINLHSTNPDRPNDYRDLVKLIASSYANVTNLPIFGFGAKTSKYSTKATGMFPLTRSIRNPFTPNDDETLMKTYTDCL